MAFSEKQQEYFYNAIHRWNVKSGATRSGKTYMDYFVLYFAIFYTRVVAHNAPCPCIKELFRLCSAKGERKTSSPFSFVLLLRG